MTQNSAQTKQLQTVLYVDDEPDIREIVELSLTTLGGLNVSTCASGTDAIDHLTRSPTDLVLLDVMMPGLDGPATLAKMRSEEALSTLPVVFMTAKALPQEIDRFLSLGAVGVINKPFDPMLLADRVRDIWANMGRSTESGR